MSEHFTCKHVNLLESLEDVIGKVRGYLPNYPAADTEEYTLRQALRKAQVRVAVALKENSILFRSGILEDRPNIVGDCEFIIIKIDKDTTSPTINGKRPLSLWFCSQEPGPIEDPDSGATGVWYTSMAGPKDLNDHVMVEFIKFIAEETGMPELEVAGRMLRGVNLSMEHRELVSSALIQFI